MDAGYKKFEVYKLAYELSLKVHTLSLSLPKFEMYEEGSQVRRSAKSICANIVEGFALRKYKNEYLHYLYRAYASCEETKFHLEVLSDSGSVNNNGSNEIPLNDYSKLSAMLFNFIRSVERNYDIPNYLKEPEQLYNINPNPEP